MGTIFFFGKNMISLTVILISLSSIVFADELLAPAKQTLIYFDSKGKFTNGNVEIKWESTLKENSPVSITIETKEDNKILAYLVADDFDNSKAAGQDFRKISISKVFKWPTDDDDINYSTITQADFKKYYVESAKVLHVDIECTASDFLKCGNFDRDLYVDIVFQPENGCVFRDSCASFCVNGICVA